MPDLPINESALQGHQEDRGGIELGVVGWPGDADHAAVSAEDLNGRTLVKVTLLRGATGYDADVPDGEARGTRIRCRVKGPDFYVPPKGTEVMVAIPAGFGLTDGAPVILACMGATPDIQYSKTRAKFDYGPDIDVVFKARSVTISDYEDRFVAVGPDTGIMITDADGTMIQIKNKKIVILAPDASGSSPPMSAAVVTLAAEAIGLVHKSDAGMVLVQLGDGDFQALGLQGVLKFGATLIGIAASPVTAAVTAPPSSPGAAGVASTSVFISP